MGGGVCDDKNDMYKINIYHPDTNKWDSAVDTPHKFFAMTILVDKLIIVGGVARGSHDKVSNKLFVLEGGQWKNYAEMPTARASASAVSHQSMMVVIGGNEDENHTLGTTELLDSITGQWFRCDDLPRSLICLQSVIVGDMLYTLGGGTPDNKPSEAVYAASLNALSSHQIKWQQLVNTPWGCSAAVNLGNKYLLAVGGAAMYDTVCVLKGEDSTVNSTSWEPIGSLPNLRTVPSAISLANKIIIIGGVDEDIQCHRTVTIGTLQYSK